MKSKMQKGKKNPTTYHTSQSNLGLPPFRVPSKSAEKNVLPHGFTSVRFKHIYFEVFFLKKLESLFLIGMQHKESSTQNGIIQNDNCIVAFSGY